MRPLPPLLLTVCLCVAACAAAPPPQVADAKPPACHKEDRVGSNIPVLVCDAPMTDEERQRMVDTLQNATRAGSAARTKNAGGS